MIYDKLMLHWIGQQDENPSFLTHRGYEAPFLAV